MIKYTFRITYLDINTNLLCRSVTVEIEAACEYDAFHVAVNTAIVKASDVEELSKIELDKHEVI